MQATQNLLFASKLQLLKELLGEVSRRFFGAEIVSSIDRQPQLEPCEMTSLPKTTRKLPVDDQA